MNALFGLFPGYVVDWFTANSTERTVPPREVLIRQGERGESMFLVMEGVFETIGWEQTLLGTSGPGDLLGEMTFVDGAPAAASVIARESSRVLEMPYTTLRSGTEADPGFAADFFRAVAASTAERLRLANLALFATETMASRTSCHDPELDRAHQAIDTLKQVMLGLERHALKNGGTIPEASYEEFFGGAMQFMAYTHHVLGPESPLPEASRNQVGVRLQHEFLPYLLTTETAERFYSKPRGYAGDFVSINSIYRNEPRGTGRLGPVIDRMFLGTPPCVAVRNRRGLLAREIIHTVEANPGGTANVMCVASGPATEVFDVYAALDNPQRLKATLLDIDIQALAFADELRERKKLTAQVSLQNENLIALILGRARLTLSPQNLVYSIGLIDYLNDRLVVKLLNFAYEYLAPGGRVILGNFHPRNPAKEFMDHVLEWTLIHRTEDDMNRLFSESRFGGPCSRIQFEESGINLFAEGVKVP